MDDDDVQPGDEEVDVVRYRLRSDALERANQALDGGAGAAEALAADPSLPAFRSSSQLAVLVFVLSEGTPIGGAQNDVWS